MLILSRYFICAIEWLNIMKKNRKEMKDIKYNLLYSINVNHNAHLTYITKISKQRTYLLTKTFPPRESEAKDNWEYRYTINDGQCSLSSIRYTQCTLKQRFSGRAQNGSTKKLILTCRLAKNEKTKELLNIISISYRSNDKINLLTKDALFIYRLKPNIKTQNEFYHSIWICFSMSYLFLICSNQAYLVIDVKQN